MAKISEFRKNHKPKWATHFAVHPMDGEEMFIGEGKIMSKDSYDPWECTYDTWEDEDYCAEHFSACGWRVEPLRALVLENK